MILKPIAKKVVPASMRRWMRTMRARYVSGPAYKHVSFGDLRRLSPISFGYEVSRGTLIDRYYIDKFVADHAEDIRGTVLELADNDYTIRFGGNKVNRSEVLDIRPDHPGATIRADLNDGIGIPTAEFDCVILTQTLMLVYDLKAAVQNVFRCLKPGGCVLVSVAGIAPITPIEMNYCGDYWRFTSLSMRRLFEEVFPPNAVTVETRGNVLATVAFMHGLAAEEFSEEELDYCDSNYEVSIFLRAVRPIH